MTNDAPAAPDATLTLLTVAEANEASSPQEGTIFDDLSAWSPAFRRADRRGADRCGRARAPALRHKKTAAGRTQRRLSCIRGALK